MKTRIPYYPEIKIEKYPNGGLKLCTLIRKNKDGVWYERLHTKYFKEVNNEVNEDYKFRFINMFHIEVYGILLLETVDLSLLDKLGHDYFKVCESQSSEEERIKGYFSFT